MSDLNTDYQLRSAIESAVVSYFAAQAITAVSRINAPANFQQKTPRVEIKAIIGGATGRRHICPADGVLRFDAWTFSLQIQTVCRPNNDPTQNNLVELFNGNVRSIISNLGGPESFIDTTNFPNHYIAEPLKDSGSADTLKTDIGEEFTILSYAGIICIRHAAWPTS